MPRTLPGVAKILAIASGKGGVGKTTVSVHLALALAGLGARVGIFDADIYGPNVPLMLAIHRTASAHGMLPVAFAQERPPSIPPYERHGIKVMSIGLLVGEHETIMPDSNFVGRIVTQTLRDVQWSPLDYLLIDLPPGTGEPQHSLIKTIALDGVLLVTTPQDISLLDTSRSLGLFQQMGVAIIGVIENMSYQHCPHCGERIDVFQQSGRRWALATPEARLLGQIPLDISFSSAIVANPTDTPSTPSTAIFRTIANTVIQRLDNTT